jgi:cysteine desulfurase
MADKIIYLDNAATTRVTPEVAEVVLRCMSQEYGNPSSAHHLGISAEREVKRARAVVGAAIGDPDLSAGEIFWTSGGTEGDALGVLGAARAARRRGQKIAYSAIEHSAVRESVQLLARRGWKATVLPVDATGTIDVERAIAAIDAETTVCAVMLVNNEIGTIEPVAELAAHLREREIHLHCDAVQALGKITVDVQALGADSVAFAAHKIHGPKGVGALWVRRGARLEPMWGGGGHQDGIRSGTLNVPGIAGMAEAVRLCEQGLSERTARYRAMAQTLIDAAERTGLEVRVNGGRERAPHIISIAFGDVPAEPLLHILESRGVMVSAGSACSERDRRPSPVLGAIALPDRFGTVRFSFGRETTEAEVGEAAEIVSDAVASFR